LFQVIFQRGAVVVATRQTWDPERYARNARFVAELGMPVVDLLAPLSGERILDVGCGDGALTVRLRDMGCIVVGIDSSEAQVAAACAVGVDARVMSADAMTFEGGFDAVFSNAALHWVKRDPAAAIDGAWRALEPGGRFVAEFGGHGCVRTIEAALVEQLARRGVDPQSVHPWYFPSDDEYRALLERRGFVVEQIALIPRPTPLPGDLSGWLETFAESFTTALPPGERSSYLADVTDVLRPGLCDASGRWTADYVRLRLRARKPGARQLKR
jgi:SAM-dependent methyltransferase